jgi:hypothetical protein
MDKEAINIAKSASVDITDSKKCPFRCPFVFDSYPLNEDFMRASEEEALREEQVISLFWAKVTSLLHAAALANILDIKKVPSRLHLAEEIDYGRIFSCAIVIRNRVFLRNTRNEFSLMLNPGRWVLQASIQSTTVRNEKGATASSVSTSMDILEKASGLSYLLVSWKKLG